MSKLLLADFMTERERERERERESKVTFYFLCNTNNVHGVKANKNI